MNLEKNKKNGYFVKRQMILSVCVFGLVYLFYFSFGFHHISEFITADEHFWVNTRIHTYWKSVFSPEEWEKTRLSDKPGVTVALISGIGLLKENNPYQRIQDAQKDSANEFAIKKSVYTTMRIPMLVFSAIFSLYLFWIIKMITGNHWIAFWSFILMLLSPILLGISQITNADAVMWSFSSATLLSFYAYLKTEEKKFLVLSPFFLGLTLLTKLVGVVFFPFLLMVALAFMASKFPEWEEKRIEISKKILKFILAYLITFGGSLLVFAIFMPAVFKNHQLFFDYTVGYSSMKTIVPILVAIVIIVIADAVFIKSRFSKQLLRTGSGYFVISQKIIFILAIAIFLAVLLNWKSGQFMVNPENILNYKTHELEFLKNSNWPQQIIYQFYSLVFSLTPLVVLALLFAWGKAVWKKISDSFLLFILALFLLVYYAALIAQNLPSTIRYSIALYPLASIMAAIGLNEFFSSEKTQKINKAWISLGLIAVSAFSLWQIKPFYFNYTNDLLPKKYSIAYSWGYGGYEAAQFMNSLPNAENIVVWSDYYGFSNFFKGTTYRDLNPGKNDKPIDYYVLTAQGKTSFSYWCNRYKRICKKAYVPVMEYYGDPDPIWQLLIDGRPGNFVSIYKAKIRQ
jgi:hypothetical protein